jgi:hypothetical protein
MADDLCIMVILRELPEAVPVGLVDADFGKARVRWRQSKTIGHIGGDVAVPHIGSWLGYVRIFTLALMPTGDRPGSTLR